MVSGLLPGLSSCAASGRLCVLMCCMFLPLLCAFLYNILCLLLPHRMFWMLEWFYYISFNVIYSLIYFYPIYSFYLFYLLSFIYVLYILMMLLYVHADCFILLKGLLQFTNELFRYCSLLPFIFIFYSYIYIYIYILLFIRMFHLFYYNISVNEPICMSAYLFIVIYLHIYLSSLFIFILFLHTYFLLI